MSDLSFQKYFLNQEGESTFTKIYSRPRKPKREPSFSDIPSGTYHQADVLYLPQDPHTRDKFLLVVVDVGSGQTWAEPMKRVSDTPRALKEIYEIVKLPRILGVDSGGEFKGQSAKWLKSKNVFVKTALTARHSQQAMVERRNRAIGEALIKLMSAREELTGKLNREWVDDLPKVMEWVNKLAKRRETIKKKRLEKMPGIPLLNKRQPLLDEGIVVRVALDYPHDVTGKRLHGTFRAGDKRWSKPVRIYKVILNRNQPVMYQVETMEGVPIRAGYVREKIQPVTDEEKPIPRSVIHAKKKRVDRPKTPEPRKSGRVRKPIVSKSISGSTYT